MAKSPVVEFQDLNNVCPKDKFSLPNIDMLVEATVGHSMFFLFSFCTKSFSGYISKCILMMPKR